MKKSILLTSLAVVAVMGASAQSVQRDEVPKPPPPPKPPVARLKDVPPPPPVPEPPDAPPPPPAPAENGAQLPDEFDAFLRKNPSVKNVHWRNDEIIIGLKSGKEERYDLNDAGSKKAAEAKYGALPQTPPPPPPPPPPPSLLKKGRTLS